MKDHPFFEQTWYARHILDHSSPLVKPRTRKLIKVHDGKWPRAIFSYNKKYSSLTDSHPLAEHLRKFDKILVTVSGTEFDTGRDVSRTHKYGPESVILGARFGSMEVLSTDPTRTGRLELEKINDIVLQPGHLLPGRLVQGGGERGVGGRRTGHEDTDETLKGKFASLLKGGTTHILHQRRSIMKSIRRASKKSTASSLDDSKSK